MHTENSHPAFFHASCLSSELLFVPAVSQAIQRGRNERNATSRDGQACTETGTKHEFYTQIVLFNSINTRIRNKHIINIDYYYKVGTKNQDFERSCSQLYTEKCAARIGPIAVVHEPRVFRRSAEKCRKRYLQFYYIDISPRFFFFL